MGRESKIEKQYKSWLKKRYCGEAEYYRLTCPGRRGFPDGTVMFKGRVMFLEFKDPETGEVSEQQRKWGSELSYRGFYSFVVDSALDARVVTERYFAGYEDNLC